MTFEKKLKTIKTMLGIAIDDVSIDNEISAYLDMAKEEILNCMYPRGSQAEKRAAITEVPLRYEQIQIQAVVNGYSHRGAEDEKVHNENGINRTFVYGDMLAYINANVRQII